MAIFDSLTMRNIIKGLVSIQFFAGVGLTLMSFGILDIPADLEQVCKHGYYDVFGIDIDPVLGLKIVGLSKMLGIIALNGFLGGSLEFISNLCLLLPSYAAYRGHKKLGDNSEIAPLIACVFYVLLLLLPKNTTKNTKTE